MPCIRLGVRAGVCKSMHHDAETMIARDVNSLLLLSTDRFTTQLKLKHDPSSETVLLVTPLFHQHCKMSPKYYHFSSIVIMVQAPYCCQPCRDAHHLSIEGHGEDLPAEQIPPFSQPTVTSGVLNPLPFLQLCIIS